MKKRGLKTNNFRIWNLQSAICNPRGFTLIELAIVLVVVGIMVGLTAGIIGPLMKQYKYTQSRGIIDAAIESATSYAAGTEDIPVDNPAQPNDFRTIVTEPTDGFKKGLVYFADSSLSVANSREVCKKKTADITVYNCNDAGCTVFDTINNVAFVFVSGGANFNVQTATPTMPPSITTCPTTQCVTVYEQDTPNIGTPSDNYDDIVKWVTLNELKTKAGCLGAPLKILNNELPFGTGGLAGGTAYSATIFADGGVPFTGSAYKWCIVDTNSLFPALNITNPALCTGAPSCSPMLAEVNWSAATPNVTITGTTAASSQGTYRLTVYVRDDNDGNPLTDNDNCAQKNYVVTINP